MRRRDFVAGSLAVAAAPLVTRVPAANAATAASIPYGAAVRGDVFVDDYDYRKALVEYCKLVVGEGGLKWFDLRPSAQEFNFFDADRLFDFATQNGMKMRGHTLVWYGAMPEWTKSIKGASEAFRELTHHIEKVVGHYKGRIPSWDVVNEAIDDEPSDTNYLRPNVWFDNLGGDYIETAFRRAADSDPKAQLVINEYDIEFVGDRFKRRRDALLKVVKNLKERDAPIHAVGFQGHLRGELEIDKDGVSSFVAELKAMDIDVLVTELDVIDNLLPPDDAAHDQAVAARVADFLGAIFDAARPTAILTWGISDRYTWVPTYFARDDGQPNRPLPLDRDYRPKPFMKVIEEFAGRAS
jgi:endo-1,4-beta-xylanase